MSTKAQASILYEEPKSVLDVQALLIVGELVERLLLAGVDVADVAGHRSTLCSKRGVKPDCMV